MKRKIVLSLGILALSMVLGGCKGQAIQKEETKSVASANKGSTDKTYKIGVLQLVQHAALDASNKGFFAALDDAGLSYTADQQNAGGEVAVAQTIADKLVNDKDDLIFAIATPAAQAVAGLTSDIPVVITAVTDPAGSGLVESNDKPGKNITGTSDLTPAKAKKVGMLYSSAEANSAFQIKLAHEAAKNEGLEYEDYSVSSLNEIQSVVESMVGKVDAIYVPTDNMIASGMSTVSMIATENNIPIIGAEVAHVDDGALATYGINYYELGYLAGKQAVKILKDGVSPKDMPIEYLPADKCEFSVNEEVAKTLSIDVSSIKK